MTSIIINTKKNFIDNFIIENPIQHFLMLKANKSYDTANAYKNDILQFFNVKNINDISINHITKVTKKVAFQWLFYLKNEKQYSTSTINRKISSLSALYNYFISVQNEENKIIKYNPFTVLNYERPKIHNKSKEFLTEEEMSSIYNNFDISNLIELRNKIIVGLLFTIGLRRFELAKIKIGDIRKYQDIWIIDILGKGQRLEQEVIQPEIKELIDLYLLKTNRNYTKHKKDFLFKGHSSNGLNKEKLSIYSINEIFKKICKKNNIEKNVTVHGARHSCITAAAINGANFNELKVLARHKSIQTTAIYIHEVDKFKNYAGNKINIFNKKQL